MNSRFHATTGALALAIGAAFPAVSTAQQSTARQDTGWTMPYERGFWGHAGLSLGRSELDITCPAGAACDDTEQAFRAFVGGRFNNTIGGEIAYIKFGDFTRGGGETDVEGVDLALMAGIPFGNNWSIFGKLGGIYSQVDVTGAAPGAAADHGAGARQQLVQVEGLHQVVVRADVEAGDAVGHRVARGDDQHRHVAARAAHRLQHLEAVLARQPEVEQREVVGAVPERELGGGAVAHPVDRVAGVLHAVHHGAADHRIVFHHQHPHAR